MKKGTKNTNAITLITPPALPRLHLDGGSGSPLNRFERIHPMQRIYEDISATKVSERIALNAASEPRLIREMIIPPINDTTIALTGMGNRGFTLDRKGLNGSPLSRAKLQICLLAVAISAMTAPTSVMMMIADMMFVAARELVML